MFKKKKFSAILFLIALTLSFILTQSVQAVGPFNRDLKVGDVNSDVKELQNFLNTNGFVLTQRGFGSLGHETNYFGTVTKNALAKFQKANKIIPAIGFFDLVTRNIVNKIIASLAIKNNLTGGALINIGNKPEPDTKIDSKIDTPVNNQLNSRYSLGGSITGLVDTVVLQNNGGDDLTVDASQGSNFTFLTSLANGSNYNVTAKAKDLDQNCYLKNNEGIVNAASITDIQVACGRNLNYNPFTYIFSNGGVSNYTLTYGAGSNGSITGATSQTVSRGNNGSAVTAVANSGYHFVNWSDSSTANPRTDTGVTGNITVSANFASNPVATTITITSGNPQAATIDSMFSLPLTVTVTDAEGHPVSGVFVVFTAPATGASVLFSSMFTSATATTNASGVATSPALTANGFEGHYQITVTSGSLTPVNFNLTNQNAV
ncbi:MAG: peptidoglycan-binding protein [Candidatus Falkowbacteria bacterium]